MDGERAGDSVAWDFRTYSAGSYSTTFELYSGICIGRKPLAVLRALAGRGESGTVKGLKGPSLFLCHESSERGCTTAPMSGPPIQWLDLVLIMGSEV